MSQLPVVRIVSDEQTNGYALCLTDSTSSDPRFLFPVRYDEIFFAECLNPDEILIAAGAYRQSFLAVVDIVSGDVIRRSAPFEGSYRSTRFFVDTNGSFVFATGVDVGAFCCWNLDTLEVSKKANMFHENGIDISFDQRDRYFIIAGEPGKTYRQFHSQDLEDEYSRATENETLWAFPFGDALVGQREDGSIVLPIERYVKIPDDSTPLGWRGGYQRSGFLFINADSWLAKRADKYGDLIKQVSEDSHDQIYDYDEFDGRKASSFVIKLDQKDADGYSKALKDAVDALSLGIDRLRFGNSFEFVFECEGERLDEFEFCRGFDYFVRSDEGDSLLESLILAYTRSIDERADDWSSYDQIYFGSVEEGVPALCSFVKVSLVRKTVPYAAIRKYLRQLDEEHTRDDFLKVGSRYFGISEDKLRTAVFCQVNLWCSNNWNDNHLIDVAAGHHSPEVFLRTLESVWEEQVSWFKERGWEEVRISEWRKYQKRHLLDGLRDGFDVKLRELIE